MAIKIKVSHVRALKTLPPYHIKGGPSVSYHYSFRSTRRKIDYSPLLAARQKSANLMRREPENRREQRAVRQEADTESVPACAKKPTLRGSHRAGEMRGRAAKEQHKSGRTEGDRIDTGWVAPCLVARSAGEEGDCPGDRAPGKSRRGSGEGPASVSASAGSRVNAGSRRRELASESTAWRRT